MTLVLTHITTSKILSALLLQLYASYCYAEGIFEFYMRIIMYAYHTQKWGNSYSDMLQHVPALLYKIYLVNEHMNLCTMWYVTCCNNVEIHTTGFLTGFYRFFTGFLL